MLVSCGKTINDVSQKNLLSKNVSFYLIESNCLNNPKKLSAAYNEVLNFYNNSIYSEKLKPGNWLDLNLFDFKNPLIASEEILYQMLLESKQKLEVQSLSKNDLDKLLEVATRYEGQKCQFSSLGEKQKQDLRPYLRYTHKCYQFNLKNECDDDALSSIFKNDNKEAENDLEQMCLSVEKASICLKEIEIKKRSKDLSNLTKKYLEKFTKERFESLFLLKADNNRFSCQKVDGIVKISIEVFNNGWEPLEFQSLIDSIESTWKNSSTEIKLIEVTAAHNETLKIVPLANGISHVNSNEPRTIYLNRSLDLFNLRKAVAHEFGHILGFPDCYIEFFDQKRRELVYYELSKENSNLMCSLKTGSKIPDQYFVQLQARSCIF
jgi:hypothetical protein